MKCFNQAWMYKRHKADDFDSDPTQTVAGEEGSFKVQFRLTLSESQLIIKANNM